MKLFHYAKQSFSELRTLERQRPLSEKERKEASDVIISGKPGFYFQHISFFIEPVPLDLLGSIFGNSHHTWYPGSELFQYTVESSKLGSFKYEVVESPEKTELYYDDDLTTDAYVKAHRELLVRLNYVGDSNAKLIAATRHLMGTTRAAFQQLPKRPNWSDIKNKYAPTVAHVMVYPASGIIQYESVSKVIVK